MHKRIIGVVLAWLLSFNADACDICGCSASANFLGILPQYQKHFVGLSYQYQSFTSTHPEQDGTTPSTSQDYFHSTTIWGRFYPLKRLQLFAFVPYQYNYAKEGGKTSLLNGMGDVMVSANYIIIQDKNIGKDWQHNLVAGAGIKAPTGRTGIINNEGIIINNMQPGTGTWDFSGSTIYTIRHKKTGANIEATYRIGTTNNQGYRYGNRLNIATTAFLWQKAGAINLLPQLGIKYLQSDEDFNNYEYQIANPYSGGHQWYGSVGVGLYLKQLSFTAAYNLPLSSSYAKGLVTNHSRYECQILYLF